MKKAVVNTIKEFARSMVAGEVDPVIEVESKGHFGTEHIYVTSKHKEAIQDLTGSKTLTTRHIKALKDLGFTIKEKTKSEKVF
jgi:hypothetical protein